MSVIHLKEKNYDLIVTSPTGASHTEKSTPCQDAAMANTLFFKGEPIIIFGVADGHGSSKYIKSEVGSFLSLNALFLTSLKYLDLITNLNETDFGEIRYSYENRFIRDILLKWEELVIADYKAQNKNDELSKEEIKKLYGTTLSYGIIYDDTLIAGQIGDGGMFYIQDNGSNKIIEKLLPEENPNMLGSETDSLCSKNAQYAHQMIIKKLQGNSIIFLSTDGVVDTLGDSIEQMLEDLMQKIKEKGFEWFKSIWIEQLYQWSDKGYGDDMANILIFVNEN